MAKRSNHSIPPHSSQALECPAARSARVERLSRACSPPLAAPERTSAFRIGTTARGRPLVGHQLNNAETPPELLLPQGRSRTFGPALVVSSSPDASPISAPASTSRQ